MKYRFVFQNGVTDCGYASLSMIFKYYNKKFNETELRKKLKINKNGTSAYNMLQASKYYGFDSSAYKMDITNLYNQKLPCIAHTIKDNLQHFVVIYKLNKDIITLADPAKGITNISINDFLNVWTGIILLFKLNSKKPIGKIMKNPDNIIFNTLKLEKHNLFKIIIFSLFASLLNIIFSFLISYILWKIIKGSDIKDLLIYLLVVGIFKELISYIRNKLLIKFNSNYSSNLTEITINHLLNLPHKFYQKYYSGEIVSRIKDLSFITNIISKFSLIIFIDLIFLIIIFLILIIYNIYIAIFLLIVSILFIIIVKIYSNLIKTKTYLVHIKAENFFSKLVDTVENIYTVKNLNIEKNISKKLKDIKDDMYAESVILNNKYNNQFFLKSFVNLFFWLVFLILTTNLIKLDIMKLSSLLIINTYISLFVDLLINVLDSEQDFQEAFSSYRRLEEIYNEKCEDNNGLDISHIDNVAFSNTNYSYDGHTKVLNNINLEITRGEKILVTGPSGSGKSTLFKLLNKQLSNSKVYINNIELNKISPSNLRRLISYVDQDEKLFTDSIQNNLVLNNNYKKDVTDIIDINDLINKKNNMLEDVSSLSGGEKSKIIIGRTLMLENDMIIFDETTSQIDTSSERKILKQIFKNFPNKILVIISHRLVNKDIFDKVIYFENGKIKEVKNNG